MSGGQVDCADCAVETPYLRRVLPVDRLAVDETPRRRLMANDTAGSGVCVTLYYRPNSFRGPLTAVAEVTGHLGSVLLSRVQATWQPRRVGHTFSICIMQCFEGKTTIFVNIIPKRTPDIDTDFRNTFNYKTTL